MASHDQYARPPIAEALIAIRCQPIEKPIIAKDSNPLPELFTQRGDIRMVEAQLEQGPGGSTSRVAETPIGISYHSENKRFVAQVLTDGLIVSWINAAGQSDWPGWDGLRDQAQAAWENYVAQHGPVELAHVGVRYINELKVPVSDQGVSLDMFLRTLPDLSRDLPYQQIAGYTMHLQLPQPDLEAVAVLNQALLPSAETGVINIGLDIDVRRNVNSTDVSDVKTLWGLIEQLHEREHQVFKASITQRTRESFGGIQS